MKMTAFFLLGDLLLLISSSGVTKFTLYYLLADLKSLELIVSDRSES